MKTIDEIKAHFEPYVNEISNRDSRIIETGKALAIAGCIADLEELQRQGLPGKITIAMLEETIRDLESPFCAGKARKTRTCRWLDAYGVLGVKEVLKFMQEA